MKVNTGSFQKLPPKKRISYFFEQTIATLPDRERLVISKAIKASELAGVFTCRGCSTGIYLQKLSKRELVTLLKFAIYEIEGQLLEALEAEGRLEEVMLLRGYWGEIILHIIEVE